MKIFSLILALSCLPVLNGCIVIAKPSHANLHFEKKLTLSTEDISELIINSAAGSVVIEGIDGINSITVVANIYTSSKYRDNIELTLTKDDNEAELVAHSNHGIGFWQGSSPRIDLVIKLPKHLILNINDNSGDIRIQNIKAPVHINDGPGDLIVNNVIGNLTINDDSGNIKTSNIEGSVSINDGSGDMTVTNIIGNVSINDDSGNIETTNIKGFVDINDGSGDIKVQDVTDSTTINDGSGDLTVGNIAGAVTIDDGSGAININNVGDLTILEAGSGSLNIKNVKGDFSIND